MSTPYVDKAGPNLVFWLADSLAADFVESYLADNMGEMMIVYPAIKARAIRDLSESNPNQLDPRVQEFQNTKRIIYSVLFQLLEGKKGYKLVKQDTLEGAF